MQEYLKFWELQEGSLLSLQGTCHLPTSEVRGVGWLPFMIPQFLCGSILYFSGVT